jgi:glycerophosphodiester phosphodiesterase
MVKENGLVCMTYGTLNNDPKNVRVSTLHGRVLTMMADCGVAARKGRH